MDTKINIEDVIAELDNIEYTTIAEKAEKQFKIFFTKFGEEYSKNSIGDTVNDSVKKDMTVATYNMSLQAMNQAMNFLEYAYLLTLSVNKTISDYDLTFDESTTKAMEITDKFISGVAKEVRLDFNDEVKELIKNIKTKDNSHE